MASPRGIRRIAYDAGGTTLANGLRNKRFAPFASAVERLLTRQPTVSIIDVGGTRQFWESRGYADRPEIEILAVNVFASSDPASNVQVVEGSATDLGRYDDNAFDIAFSNSTIEHLFTLDGQAAMAREIRRLAPSYWVQTPNYWFPIEPHFLTPGWQWLPIDLRVRLLQRHRFGWRGPAPDPVEARALVEEVRLLTRREVRALFPDGTLRTERVGPFAKSFTVSRGLDGD